MCLCSSPSADDRSLLTSSVIIPAPAPGAGALTNEEWYEALLRWRGRAGKRANASDVLGRLISTGDVGDHWSRNTGLDPNKHGLRELVGGDGPSLRGRLPRRHLSTSHFEVRASGETSLYDVPRELLGRGLLDAARHFSVELWWVLGAGEDAECERRRCAVWRDIDDMRREA